MPPETCRDELATLLVRVGTLADAAAKSLAGEPTAKEIEAARGMMFGIVEECADCRRRAGL